MTAGTILVVDDELMWRELLSMALSGAGYAVETASSGAAALATLRAREFDVLVLDLFLTDMSGFDVLRAVTAENGPAPACVMLSGSPAEAREEAQALGVAKLLGKPVSRPKLTAAVAEVLAGR